MKLHATPNEVDDAGDHVDPDELISPRLMEKLTGMSDVTIWRLRRRGDFPEPIIVSPGRKAYTRSQYRAWIRQRRGLATGNPSAE